MVKAEIRSCHLNWSIVITDQDLRTSIGLLLAMVIFGWLSVAHLFCFMCCDFWLVECCSPF